MNGATALDCEKTISRPNSTNTMTMGTSQYFFSCFRNWKNSPSTRPLLISNLRLISSPASVHLIVVFGIPVPFGIRRPPRPLLAPARERIAAHQLPQQVHRRQDEQKQQREPEARRHAA